MQGKCDIRKIGGKLMLTGPIFYGWSDCLERCELDNGLSTNVCFEDF